MQALLATASLQKAAKLLEDAAAGKYKAKAASLQQAEDELARTSALHDKLEMLLIPAASTQASMNIELAAA